VSGGEGVEGRAEEGQECARASCLLCASSSSTWSVGGSTRGTKQQNKNRINLPNKKGKEERKADRRETWRRMRGRMNEIK
jgi:hypothetical protein